MTPKELADKLTGAEYRDETTQEIEIAAKAAGLVIVFGASDDLMEFRGAIEDEVGAYGGAKVTVDAQGILSDFDGLLDGPERTLKDKLRDYFKREDGGRVIKALWNDEEGRSWTYETDIPHETFEVVEDGEPYCRGIVFALADVAVKAKDPTDG